MDKKKIKKLLEETKLPNKITILRIILTPIIIVLLLNPSYYMKVTSLILFIFACITDKIDGILARKYDIITKFGKFVDPLADKILLNSLFITLAIINILEWWMVILMVLREFIIQILRIIAETNKTEVHATSGKIKGPLQMIVIISAMYFMIISFEDRKSILDPWMLHSLSIMMIFTLFVTYSAMLEFLIRNWSSYKKLLKRIL